MQLSPIFKEIYKQGSTNYIFLFETSVQFCEYQITILCKKLLQKGRFKIEQKKENILG